MAAHIDTPSRRFIKVYLGTWGLLAVGALCYLAMLSFPSTHVAAPVPQAAVEPVRVVPVQGRSESKAIAEVQGSLSEIRKDVTELQTAVGERVVNEKVVHTRLSALEDRVSTIDPAQGGEPGEKVAQGGEPPAAAPGPGAAKAEGPPTPPARPVFVPIETGSIPPKEDAKEEIVFGAPVVTRSRTEFAVQLAAAPNVNALRQSWGQLSERHAGALGTLQPRVVPPRSEGGIYRLLAGPFASKADAERVCAELRVGPKACFATPYVGTPL